MKTKFLKKICTNRQQFFVVLSFLLSGLTMASAQDFYHVYTKDTGIVKIAGNQTDSVKVENGIINFYANNAVLYTKVQADVDSIKFIDPSPHSTAYPDGVPHNPGVVEAEDFDRGGEGIAFHDVDGHTGPDYRPDPADAPVDLQSNSGCSNGLAVVGTVAGEWLNYTINAPIAGLYAFTFYVYCDHTTAFKIFIDGTEVREGTVLNSSWGVVPVQLPNIELSEGVHVLRFEVAGDGGFGFDKFEFMQKVSTAYPDGVPHEQGVVEAEDFDMGGEGIAFHDLDPHDGPVYRTNPEDAPVDLQAGGNYSNGFAVVRTETGEWLNYTINAPKTGRYNFTFYVNCDRGTAFKLYLDELEIREVTVPNTSWAVRGIPVPDIEIPAGVHILRFEVAGGGGFGFDKFEFQKVDEPESWSLILLPDPQLYSAYNQNQPVLDLMMEWIVKERNTALNPRLVVCVGDLVHHNEFNDPTESNQTPPQQWASISKSFGRLDGKLPYVTTTGNHDFTGRKTFFDDYFSVDTNPLNQNMLRDMGTNSDGNPTLSNASFEFESPSGKKFLILAVEWNPREETLEWAKGIVDKTEYADHTVILLIHSYLDKNNQFTGEGLPVWEKLVQPSKNIQLVFAGHVYENNMQGSIAFRTDTNAGGKIVNQMVFNAQGLGGNNGGDGWLRILEFQPDGKTVSVKTFSPLFNISPTTRQFAWDTQPYNEFSFTLE